MTFLPTTKFLMNSADGLASLITASSLTFWGSASKTISRHISGNISLVKNGTGILKLTNTANSFSGDVTVLTGILESLRGALGVSAGKTYINSTGSTTTGGQLYLNANGILYNEAKNVVIQGTDSPSNGSGTAALRFGGSAGSASTFCNMNGSITLDGNASYKIDVYLQPSHWKINGGITRSGTNTGTLFLDLSHWQQTTPVRLTINSVIDNNSGPVTLLGNSAGILQMDIAGHDIGDFTINGENAATYQTILKLGISDALVTNKNLIITKGIFDLGGYNQTVNALSGDVSVSTITNSGSADSKLTFGNGNNAATFSGVIQNGATNKISLEKVGNGMQTLFGTNTYTGLTTISAGILRIARASPNKLQQADFTPTTLSVIFRTPPLAGETYRLFPGTTAQTYASVLMIGATGRTATYDSTNSTLIIA
jgi:fibronectin-binding autotransporter adhesin